MTIADTVFGYGSPQIAKLTESISKELQTASHILQPLVPERSVIDMNLSNMTLETVATSMHPYTIVGRSEYNDKCARVINAIRPDIVIITNYLLFDIIDDFKYRPKKLIHLALEDLEPILKARDASCKIERLKRQAEKIDIWLFPESNRAQYDTNFLGIRWEKVFVFYNAPSDSFVVNKDKNGRFIYAGTLNADLSIGKYIFDEQMAPYPIDVYGDLQGTNESINTMKGKWDHLKGLRRENRVKWHGQVPKITLDKVLPEYSFSLLLWLPVGHAFLNAAPNKFFQSVATGVPVISAPHPQTKMLIERYGCGLVLDGWERHQLINGIRKAKRIFGSSVYDEMLKNCERAVSTELRWSTQFGKFNKRFHVENWD
ncbi:hypothetical protein [Candidatus Thiosymbion oneisti]|uniref:hypothetical protein n=1 Tax=Candidatus Thiosymbion oneisti TaxID=589554 RepID=UPI0010611917|nr:hypothetical protein [Candidatus Thiosymbion oneisti]